MRLTSFGLPTLHLCRRGEFEALVCARHAQTLWLCSADHAGDIVLPGCGTAVRWGAFHLMCNQEPLCIHTSQHVENHSKLHAMNASIFCNTCGLSAPCSTGSAISSGLFVPMLMLGAVIGRFIGLATVDIAQSAGKSWSPGGWHASSNTSYCCFCMAL
jgi:hypothetical protein